MTAGVVLAGGRSSRMGSPKAELEWHGSTLLAHTVRVLERVVDGPLVVVAAPGQRLPTVPAAAAVVYDPVAGRGPLQGVAAGLAAVACRAETAFVCSVDLPFLHPAFVRAVLGALGPGEDVALPVARGFTQPLAAAYRSALAGRIDALLAAGRLRPAMLFAEVAVRRLDDAALLADVALAAADPQLDSLVNVNTPDEYRAARDRPAPEVSVRAHAAHPEPQRIRAATLGEAAAAAGLAPGQRLVASLDGGVLTRDPAVPLVAGDHVTFLPAGTGG